MTLEEFLSEWNNDSDRVLVHTSGSTGKPKPMMVEKKRMLNSARITCDFLGLKPGDTALLCMSLDYIAGKMVVVRSIERHLQLIAVHPSGHPLKDIADNQKITFAAMVPMQVYNTLQVPEERERLCHIKHLIIGGGAIDEALGKQLKALPGDIAIWSTYGMTETLSHIALRRINGKEASDWYTPFDSVKISQTEEGCLVIDAPLVCDKPLVTNDIVEIKEKECNLSSPSYIYNKVGNAGLRFRIKGRKDNVICSGGIKIQIEEVEALLKPYLDKPFMLAKKKDEKFGEIEVLLTEDEDIKKVEATVRRLLSDDSVKDSIHDDSLAKDSAKKYWIPREYMHVEHLPFTETGKPKRSILL
ncbi:MAG TPA: O-succinylbenzoic acid--CoA ligase [Prevotella sp.]|nr:O-succinylbenzoic acid--CoA ligase [Candidatus Segatella violae]